jgi:hypothetical protein
MDPDYEEVPDDEPLTEGQIHAIQAEGAKSRATLAFRAAGERMTPAEMFAAGKVQMSRNVAVPKEQPEVLRQMIEKAGFEPPDDSADDHAVEEAAKKSLRIEDDPWVQAVVERRRKTISENPLNRREPDMGSRMREWMAQNGAQHVADGFDSYFTDQGRQSPRGTWEGTTYQSGVYTPPPNVGPLNDDQVVEAELLDAPSSSDQTDDIDDAEIVE